MTPTAPVIGIRDSGVGGLTVARRIRELLPHATLLYFADTAHVPYGDRTPDEVRHYALSISEFLLQQGAQLLVFACNTSSAYALELARERFDVPIIGMIQPGACAALAASGNGPIGVIATQATVDSKVYTFCINAMDATRECIEIACPEFVPLVESEQTNSIAAYAAAKRYLSPLEAAGCRTVILGCTHYPLLLPVLTEIAPDMLFVDPAEAVAQEVVKNVQTICSSNGHANTGMTTQIETYYASGPADGVQHWIAKLMPATSTGRQVLTGPVFDLTPEAVIIR